MARSMMVVADGERLVGAGEFTPGDADWGPDEWDAFLGAEPMTAAASREEHRPAADALPAVQPARRPAPRRASLARPADGRPAPARPVGSRPRPSGQARRPEARRPAGRPTGGRTSRHEASLRSRRLRLTPRGRVTILITLAVIGFVAFGLGRASADGSGSAPAGPATVVVQQGDTLWDIASAAMPKSDPRDAVDTLKVLNHLDSADVQVGQSLRLR